MRHILTLITPPGQLDDTVVSGVSEALTHVSGSPLECAWLGAGQACDLFFDSEAPERVRATVRQQLDGRVVDWAIQPLDGRRKRLLVADLESTLIRNEMLDEMAEVVGIKPQIEAITTRAMNGELDFSNSLRERVALLTDYPVSVLEQALECLVFNPGVGILMATLRQHGVYTAIITGGLAFFAEHARRRLNCDAQHSNGLIVLGDRLTGRVREPILDASGKRRVLEELCVELGCETQQAAAVGDGANDLQMLEAAGLGVAFHAKPHVVKAARFSIRHGDLTSLLYLQGYARETWTEREDSEI